MYDFFSSPPFISRGRRPAEINCCLVSPLSLSLSLSCDHVSFKFMPSGFLTPDDNFFFSFKIHDMTSRLILSQHNLFTDKAAIGDDAWVLL